MHFALFPFLFIFFKYYLNILSLSLITQFKLTCFHLPHIYINTNSLLFRMPSASLLRSEGQCPLTPEESILMIAALGFKRKTMIYVAGAHVYGGKSRMVALHSLYPNIVTKETLLSSQEIEPFMNHTSQVFFSPGFNT